MVEKMDFGKLKLTEKNIIPETENITPDYYCTWQTQLYATSDGKPRKQRAVICEKSLFNKEKPYGWAYFYENARKDLFIVMDDSWDVPVEDDPKYYGSLVLNKEKFPESTSGTKENYKALKNLSLRVKELGWKGLGGWVCAQESEKFLNGRTQEEYWKEKLIDAAKADFAYWKVDWGKNAREISFRRMLTEMGKVYAPNLIIEHAMLKDIIPVSDVYRTYDVPAIMSIPMTMEKIREYSDCGKTEEGYRGLINCEDEAYIAAAGGFSMGIMRHPYSGPLPDGREDMSFPSVHRNIKTKLTEVIRAARWHRAAPAFGIDSNEFSIDKVQLSDTWKFDRREEEIEAWWLQNPMVEPYLDDSGSVLEKKGPARISRRTELPEVIPDNQGRVPYVVASKNPNGAYSILTAGRTFLRDYYIPKCDIKINSGDSRVIGVFGEYRNLFIKTSLDISDAKVLAQDLAADRAYDITDMININRECCQIIIPGELMRYIGTIAQPEGDTSEPGLILNII